MEVSQAWVAVEAAAAALLASSFEGDAMARLRGALPSLVANGLTSTAIAYLLGAPVERHTRASHPCSLLVDVCERHFAATLIPRFLGEFAAFSDWKQALDGSALEAKVESTLERQSHALYEHLRFAILLLEELSAQEGTNRFANQTMFLCRYSRRGCRNSLVQQFRLTCLATLIDPPSSFQQALFFYLAYQFRMYRLVHHKQQKADDEEEAGDESEVGLGESTGLLLTCALRLPLGTPIGSPRYATNCWHWTS
jgi:hypothetical protein